MDYFVRTEVAAPGPAPGFEIRDPRTKVKYFGEFREFALDREAAARPGHPEPGLTENGGLVRFVRGVWEFQDWPRGPRASRTYPQDIHKFIVFGEFGSLRV